VLLAGVETAYTFAVSSDVRYYYQEIFNPMGGNAPVYSEFASIPSDNATADILTATTTIQGKVQLATTAQPVGSTTSAGTANATVANQDHTHAGVHSVSKSGSASLLGDVTFTGANGTTLTQVSQNIEISSPSLSTSTPSAIASSGSAGSATTTSKSDHTHEGVHAVAASGNPNITGDVTIGVSGGAGISQAGSTITISAPALASTAPADVGSSASIGSGTTSARADHVHRGVASVAKSGSSQLFGDVTVTGSGGTTVTQALQNLDISSPALSSTAPSDVGSSASIGSGTTAAKADHVHRGVFSVSKNGSTQLFGSVTLSAGTGISLTQSSQDISIAATSSGGGGGSLTFYDTASPEIIAAPVARILNRGAKFAFDAGSASTDNQAIFVDVRVPTSYSGGNINLKLSYYTAATTGTINFTVTSYLVRSSTDTYTAPTLFTASTNGVSAPGVANRLSSLTVNISTAGAFGVGTASAGDIIRIGIATNIPTHTITSVLFLVTAASEVTFS
jgi:hypothetical protein